MTKSHKESQGQLRRWLNLAIYQHTAGFAPRGFALLETKQPLSHRHSDKLHRIH
ncbi:hypothetical protein [Leptolyngbya sp. FACHB-711]|uniref:hypothetical protein n=1 Tax=unclassified Leptolyngbya TaxID=2650499 RepID=UPI0016884A45|nr:hypothetical protein [Leptolyngbya sp. FACHB-711]MBD1849636.1 hypothetical protein [Cyanobacteria bacterium FACHB-502]MBD2027975.1 hypothetical protein [Leptolyngbya sp. FACHB-711]